MGRKKRNARNLPHGRKIHVNKYISQRGKVKRKPDLSPASDTEQASAVIQRTPIPKKHEIWFAALGNHYGTSVQGGERPVLVISNDTANRYSKIVTVIPLTTKMKKLGLPVHVTLSEKHCEMLGAEHLEDSVLLAEQITTISKEALYNRLCRVTAEEKILEIESAVASQLGMAATQGNTQIIPCDKQNKNTGEEV